MILKEKQQKYQHYHQAKLIKMNILWVKKYCPLIKGEIQSKLSLYFSLGKALKRHTEGIQDQGRKQIDTLKVLEPNTQQLAIKDAIPEGQINEETKMKLRELNRQKKL